MSEPLPPYRTQRSKIFRIVLYPGIDTLYVEVQGENHGGAGTIRKECPIDLTREDPAVSRLQQCIADMLQQVSALLSHNAPLL